MNKVRFKTRIFETIFFFLFGTIVGIIFFILALEVYDKSFNGFLCILIIDYFLCALFFVSSLLNLSKYIIPCNSRKKPSKFPWTFSKSPDNK